MKEEVQKSPGWAIALGSSNNDKKRSSQEALQELKRNDESQGRGRGGAKLGMEKFGKRKSVHVRQESKECMVVNMNIIIISMISKLKA